VTTIMKNIAYTVLLCCGAGCSTESRRAGPATPTDRIGNGLPPQSVLNEIESADTSDAKWSVIDRYYSAQKQAHPVIQYDLPTQLRWSFTRTTPFAEWLLTHYPEVLDRLKFNEQELWLAAHLLGSSSHGGAFMPKTKRTQGELAEELLWRVTGQHFANGADFEQRTNIHLRPAWTQPSG